MAHNGFSQLFESLDKCPRKKVVLAGSHDPHALEAVLTAEREGKIDYLLVGDMEETKRIAEDLGFSLLRDKTVTANSPEEAAVLSVKAIREKRGDFLMKGKMETATLLHQAVNKETGIGKGSLMSHLAIIESPRYHKLLGITDGGMIPYPDLEQKKGILINALDFFNSLGVEKPKVGIMAAVEVVNPKMPETLDGDTIKKESLKGAFGNCIVEGPISFDLAVSRESALIKGFESPVSGDCDIMVVPNITAGNLLVKGLSILGGGKFAGLVLGAKVPIVLSSRGSSFEEKYISLLLCAACKLKED